MTTRYAHPLADVRHHLGHELLPFWQARAVDTECGGFLTYFDANGQPTGQTDKPLLTLARCIYSFSAAHRAGYGDGAFLDMARQGFEFLTEHYWDHDRDGWCWIADRQGRPIDPSKIVYGHSFVIYGLSEYALATGDTGALDWAQRTVDALATHAADRTHGGYRELLEPDWTPKPAGPYGGDRKSMDVHMHLMEAFTALYRASGQPQHRQLACDTIDLLFDHIIHPETGLGIAQFAYDWTPLRAILFKTVWGADRDADTDQGRPLDNTSYGHNVEFGWLLNDAIDVLGLDRDAYLSRIRTLYDHCIAYGLDDQHGGVYCEGPAVGPARECNKEFWQQAETMIAMLDAVAHFHDDRYWHAYMNVHRFVFDTMIHHQVGEWWPLFDDDNNRLWEYMSTAWKVNYHTIRGMLECERRLTHLTQ